jgi:hypothetical protein
MNNAVFNVPFVVNKKKERYSIEGIVGDSYVFDFYNREKTYNRTYQNRIPDMITAQIRDIDTFVKELEDKSGEDFVNFIHKIVKERIETDEAKIGQAT